MCQVRKFVQQVFGESVIKKGGQTSLAFQFHIPNGELV